MTEPDNDRRYVLDDNDDPARLRELLEHLDQGVLILRDGTIDYANPAAGRLWGQPASAIIGRVLEDLVIAEHRPRLQCNLRPKAPDHKGSGGGCCRFRTSGGKRGLRELGARFRPLDRDYSVLQVNLQDLTPRLRSRARMQERLGRLTRLLGNLPGMAYRSRDARRRQPDFVSAGCRELTGYSPVALAREVEGFDRLIHPEDRNAVARQLADALEKHDAFSLIYRMVTASGEEKWVKEQGRGVYSSRRHLLAVEGFITDISESHRMGLKLAHQATHDHLTGLFNRRHFEQRLERAVAYAKVYGFKHALCYLDLDRFKVINDTAGHRAGDELLRHVSVLLKGAVREGDALARLGGDEFGLLLENCPLSRAQGVAENLIASIRDFRFSWEHQLFQIGVSIGLVGIDETTDSAAHLLARADIACYAAKDAGRSRVHLFQEDDSDLTRRHLELLHVASLREALEQDRFVLYCQPIREVFNPTGPAKHYEILIRLQDREGNTLMPGAFIPAAERFGLMHDLDKWVIRNVIQSYESNIDHARGVTFAINLSGNSLNDETLADYVREQLKGALIRPRQICFEITETAAVRNLTQAIWFMKEMKRLGCRFSLDDFGSGLSSFAYLKYFDTHYLKIDGSFVRDMVQDENDRILVAAINQIGHAMGIKTIAECAENQATVESLQKIGVDYVQGYAVGMPVPFDSISVVGL